MYEKGLGLLILEVGSCEK